MMLFGGHSGGLEFGAAPGAAHASAAVFPMASRPLSDGGRTGKPQKEVIAARAFAYRVEDPKEDIHLLVGHDYGQPLASETGGSLSLSRQRGGADIRGDHLARNGAT